MPVVFENVEGRVDPEPIPRDAQGGEQPGTEHAVERDELDVALARRERREARLRAD